MINKKVIKKSYYIPFELNLDIVNLATKLQITQTEFATNALNYYVDFLNSTLEGYQNYSKKSS